MSLTNASPLEVARAASVSGLALARLDTSARNAALTTVHAALAGAKGVILEANKKDLAAANTAAENGQLSHSLVKRLDLGKPGKFDDMLQGILDVRDLPDPIGRVTLRTELDDGLILERVSCPIGVLLIIFEARPEVIANIASLAIKSGNAAILKGGKESTESFKAISTVISEALKSTKVPNDAVQLVTTRDAIDPLLEQDRYINLVIPRGSNSLVRYIKDKTRIPVMGHADGLCLTYLCSDADASSAAKVIVDAKTTYPAACNSVETLLVDQDALSTILPTVASALQKSGVSLRCDPESKAALAGALEKHHAALLQDASDEDFDTEFLDLILAIKTIPKGAGPEDALEQAVSHINTHGSHHTDAIITSSAARAEKFMDAVDSAGVFWNTSTRLADGMRYGFGTEVGVSTNKIHARGPVGLEGLTVYKYKARGSMQATADYGSAGKAWKHKRLALD
ncbi:hypothetical protein FH972_023124 [Carpinus fangiana]|uniref:glutamate-5-semialdehyde dehydrogenase n=1 Tax=Carpinus fangiana TaxID=176857 RepID=A0A5N6KUR7_9ROSI|nr:hypothetical protein FH972_023124 [Carpinus fangiana]